MNALYKLVLKGSLMSAFALVTAAVGCSDTNKDDEPGAGGEAGKAGSSNVAGSTSNPGGAGGDAPTTAGTAGAGGAEGGAGPTTEGGAAGAAGGGGAPAERPDIVFSAGGDGAGGEGGAASDPTVAKFCNSLTFGPEDDQMDTTMILEIGEGADMVKFTAVSGTCAPADGLECKPIPHGAAVPVALYDADAPDTALDEGTIKSRGGTNWIFYTDLSEDADPSPIVGGAPFESPACEDIIFEDVF